MIKTRLPKLNPIKKQSNAYHSNASDALPAALSRLPPRLRLAAIAATMPVAGPDERVWLASSLVRLTLLPPPHRLPAGFANRAWRLVSRPISHAIRAEAIEVAAAAVAEVGSAWCWMPDLAKRAALESCRGRWAPAVAAAAAGKNATVRIGATDLVRAVGDAALLGPIAGLLADPDPSVVEAADSLFASAADELADGQRPELERQVAAALGEYGRHRSEGVMAAAVRVADIGFVARLRVGSGGPLAEALLDGTMDFHMPMRAFLRRSSEPWVRQRIWEWLGTPLAQPTVAERMVRSGAAHDRSAALERIHLLVNPRRRAALAALSRRGRSGGPGGAGSDERSKLNAGARAALPSWLDATGASEAQRRIATDELVGDPVPAVRLAALRWAGPEALARGCGDRDSRVAISALLRASDAGLERRRVRGREIPGDEALAAMASHGDPGLRRLAAQERCRRDPWDGSPAGRLAARVRHGESPREFEAELIDRLAGGQEQAVAALGVIRALGLGLRFERRLIDLLGRAPGGEEDDRMRPTVIGVLGDLRSEAARLAVDAYLRDQRPRMRANAVEALARQERLGPGRRADVLLELKSDPHHRVRANAIRGLFDRGRLYGEPSSGAAEPVAIEALGAMLWDGRPGHRLAGIWLAGRMAPGRGQARRRWAELAGRVADLARNDADPGARRRAAAAAPRLLAATREEWKDLAAMVAEGTGVPA